MSHVIRLVQIVNHTASDGSFENLEAATEDMTIRADGATNTPGLDGAGCDIPEYGKGEWWDSHRMTLTLGETILSLWKEGPEVYYRSYRSGMLVEPDRGRGELLWTDNGLPVILVIASDATPTMRNL